MRADQFHMPLWCKLNAFLQYQKSEARRVAGKKTWATMAASNASRRGAFLRQGDGMRSMICGLMFIALTACGKNEPKQEEPSGKTAAAVAPAPVPSGFYPPAASKTQNSGNAEFEFSAKKFATLFNQKSEQANWRFRIKNIKIENGAVNDVFQHKFSEKNILNGSVAKSTGNVTGLTAIMSTAGLDDKIAALDIMVMGWVLVATTNPTLEKGEISDSVAALIKKLDRDTNAETTINGVRYQVSAGRGLGFWWYATPVAY